MPSTGMIPLQMAQANFLGFNSMEDGSPTTLLPACRRSLLISRNCLGESRPAPATRALGLRASRRAQFFIRRRVGFPRRMVALFAGPHATLPPVEIST